MSRLADNASPFELLARDGTDARLEVAVSMARSHRGWIVTLVNSNGVTKQPSLPAVTNASAAVAISLACKPEYGRLGAASVLTDSAGPAPVIGGAVHLTIPAGDLVVVAVTLA